MEFDPTDLIRTLGSLASIASGYLNVKKAIEDNNRAERSADGRLSGTLTPQERESILRLNIQASSVKHQDIIALQIISADILEGATWRMNQARERYVRVITQGQISEIEEEEAITRREVCYFLSIILKHNGGKFPDGSNLRGIWQEFRCTVLYPEFAIRRA